MLGSPVKRLILSTAPPSVNAMWTPVVRYIKGRPKAVLVLSAEGKAWKEMAGLELMTQRGFVGPCYWRADILVPGRCKADLDNFSKGILDALGAAGKSPDDKYLVDIRYRFHGGASVKIAIKKEELHKWATIKNASKSLMKKLAKHSA